MLRNEKPQGFTLSEVLIALAILAIIAVFIIPKVLSPAHNLERRHSLAVEALGSMGQLTRSYVLQNNGCFAGNISCKVDPVTCASLDGRPTGSGPTINPDAYNAFDAYVSSHLNYTRKVTLTSGLLPNSSLYILPNGSAIQFTAISNIQIKGQCEISANMLLYLDRTPEQIEALQFSVSGVDTHTALMVFSQSGAVIGGANHLNQQNGFPYAPISASIFDWPQHPEDVCTSVGGANCNIP